MIRSNLCDYSDSNVLAKETITVPSTAAAIAVVNNTNKKVTFKNWAPVTDCITKINIIQVDDFQKIDIVMPMYYLIEHSGAYSKTSWSLWQCYRYEPALDNNDNTVDFNDDNNNSASFKFKQKITGETGTGKGLKRCWNKAFIKISK